MITTFLLKIKNWQLFLLIIFTPLIIGIVHLIIYSIFNNGSSLGLINSPFPKITYFTLFVIWNYSVISNISLNDKFLKIKVKNILQIIMIYLSLHLIIAMGNILDMFPFFYNSSFFEFISDYSKDAMSLCFFILILFSAKSVNSLQTKKSRLLFVISPYVFLIFLFPIGLWVIQPKLNNFINKYRVGKGESHP